MDSLGGERSSLAKDTKGDSGRVGGSLERLESVQLSTVSPKQVSWLWPGRLPRGKVVVLDGDPEVGKSTLCLDLAARVTAGRAFPGEDIVTVGPSNVLVMSMEDDLEDTIRPRLDAAEADVERFGRSPR